MTTHPAATAQLSSALGSTLVRTDEATCYAASFDSCRLAFQPEAVIFPRKAEDIAPVLQLANAHGVPVTVRGRGTSLTGSASPRQGGWVIDMLKLNRIRIDAESGMAQVQAGANVAKIQDAAEAQGWFYPPDPSSRAYCTIGGNIACNAGGMHGAKYGVTRDFVIALEGYLPTGEFVRWGTSTRKFAAGFNLRDLWIGSEGMLGVVTAATLRLVPQPATRWTLLVAFADETQAFRATRALFAARIQPTICEFLDRYAVQCAEGAMQTTIFPGQPGRPVMLLELSGGAAEVRDGKKVLLAWAQTHGVGHRAARTRAEAEGLWTVRRKCSSAMFELGNAKLNEDITVPLRNYEKFGRFLDKLRQSSGLAIPTFGHLGDGNLHVNIMYDRDDADSSSRAATAVEALMTQVVALGGAISGEHGIGLAKTPFMSIQHGPAELGAMRAIKTALDPQGVLNPGKMFEIFEVWKSPKVVVSLPWDHK